MLCSRVLTPGSSAQRPVPHESVPEHPVPIPRQANKAWWYAALEVATKQRHGSPPPPPPPLRTPSFQEPDTATAHRRQAQHAGLVCAPVPGKPNVLCPCGLSRQRKTAPPCRRVCARKNGIWEPVSHGGACVERTRRSLHAIAAHFTPSLRARVHAPWPRATVLARAPGISTSAAFCRKRTISNLIFVLLAILHQRPRSLPRVRA